MILILILYFLRVVVFILMGCIIAVPLAVCFPCLFLSDDEEDKYVEHECSGCGEIVGRSHTTKTFFG